MSSMASSSITGPKRILIMGGGVAGLSLALALKRVGRSTGLDLQPVIFDSAKPESYNESGPHYLLWRWAVEVLVEMGCGGRLSKIAAPVVNFQAVEAETEELLVEYPPKGHATASVDAEIGQDSALPPMVGVRRSDLLRLLLLAISGVRDDLVFGDDYLPTPANNSDLVPDPVDDLEADLAQGRWFENEGFDELVPELVLNEKMESYWVHPSSGEVTVEFESGRVERGFMLIGADGGESIVRRLMYAQSATPRHQLAHAGACVFHGITRIHVPPVDTPDALENGKPIPDLVREDVHEFVPDGRSVSIVGKGLSFGVTNLGNGLLGWNLVVAQTEANQHAGNFSMQKTRRLLSESIAKNPRQSILMLAQSSSMPNFGNIDTDSTSAEDKWNTNKSIPSRRSPDLANEEEFVANMATMTLGRRMGSGLRRGFTTPDLPSIDTSPINESGEGSSSDVPYEEASSARRNRRNRTQTQFDFSDPSIRDKLTTQLASAHPSTTSSSPSSANRRASLPPRPTVNSSPFPMSGNTPVPNLFGPPEPLSGSESRTLALRLCQTFPMPHPCHAIIARTDPSLTAIQDVMDLAEDPLDTLTIPSAINLAGGGGVAGTVTAAFGANKRLEDPHVGRVILIGDAAHPVAVNANGSLGAGLAITDAAMLAKLLAKYLAKVSKPVPATAASTMSPVSPENMEQPLSEVEAIKLFAAEFDKERCALGASVMKDARAEGGWGRTENTLLRGFMRITRRVQPTQWTRASYAMMLTRGSVKAGLPVLMPVL
ncbi:hypothetical protein HDU76_009066 [Blyttiomyces sp. JEL0837]|nr:hypothetical protein HDU76_009066 [Blyttiomyces sp. JEL0837]